MQAQAHHEKRSPSALLEFHAENARSFHDGFDFSMHATRMAPADIVRQVPWRKGGHPISVLPAAGIFGPNASGKTNALRVMDDMRSYVLNSFRLGSPDSPLPRWPFSLVDYRTNDEPSLYDIDIVLDGIRHSYGFRLNTQRILEEWAYCWPRGRRAQIFHREGDHVEVPSRQRAEARASLRVLRPNALFLSTAAAASNTTLLPLYRWFSRNLLFADVDTRTARQAMTVEFLDSKRFRPQALALLREADLGISGATKHEMSREMRERIQQLLRVLRGEEESRRADDDIEFEDFEVRLLHRVGSDEIEMDPRDESRGTMTWFGLVGPILEALNNGSVLLADEVDNSLHPRLVELLIRLFQSKGSNPHRAQLVFNSHDVTQLADSSGQLSRDQVWFTEKLASGSTHMYPLTDLKPRKQESIGSRYLAGRYGATPIISTRSLEQALASANDSID